jgi:hypothetical protein
MEARISGWKPKPWWRTYLEAGRPPPQLGVPIKGPSLSPAISFTPPPKHRRHHSISLHPDLTWLVTEEEETPPPLSEEELKSEVHHKDPMTSLTFHVSASSSPSYARPHRWPHGLHWESPSSIDHVGEHLVENGPPGRALGWTPVSRP